jgi:SAM-dependent methyltransferase
MRDPTTRFSDRVADYVRSRPSYPAGLLGILEDEAGLEPTHRVADIGSGTGLLSRLFLDHGNSVYGVEPNREMREAGDQLLAAYPGFASVAGRAEATTLPDACVDLVAAGQAFHWFDVPRARAEFLRILRPGRPVVLVWNDRREDAGPFMAGYEQLLRDYGTDYRQVHHRRLGEVEIKDFFGRGVFKGCTLPNRQSFDLPGLQARVRSSSYVPAPDGPGYTELMDGIGELFEAHQTGGRAGLEYETRIYFGRPSIS